MNLTPATRTLSRMDMQQLRRRIPRPLYAALKECPQTILAGGALRSIVTGDKVNDWDLFVTDPSHVPELMAALLRAYGTETRVVRTDNAVTICCHPPVQIITRWTYDSLEAAIASFDFSIAQAACRLMPSGEFEGVCSSSYYSDLAAKRLVYTAPVRDEEPGGSMLRLLRFTAQGYRATLHSVAGIIERLYSGVDRERATTVDYRVAALRGLLVNVDPASAWDESRVLDEEMADGE